MWVNYNDTYSVSDDGLVMNRRSGKILEGCVNRWGYRQIQVNGKTMKIHRLVGLCFLPRIDLPKLEIDHINRDKSDNRASNLRWCDSATNNQNKNSKNITLRKSGYEVEFIRYGKRVYYEYFKTIEEATTARDNYKLNLRL
jgi:hypothetical protein